ncbi:heme exporter protein D [Angulomicrobium tetraedrale]|uniref:Heme exporter protein D n=1 Tax=Ancylobacter tetraedralis TaxID=217068 RepID=A0A839ZBW5_9HYPH|nr:heme exporter protein CcmD [Ancylobacter tetraedralis]MBB3772251.1 heme exporter protein D [Ancylobacter tetraedralis]
MLGEHGAFILAAYGVSALALGALALSTFLQGRAVRRRLGELEARGVRRRSARRSLS